MTRGTDRLATLVAGCLLLGACAGRGHLPVPPVAGPVDRTRVAAPAAGESLSPPVPSAPAEEPVRSASAEVEAPARLAARHATAQVGAPYVYGGADPRGFDCSGLVQYAFGMVGLTLPRDTREQRRRGQRLADLHSLEPGDLLFFRDNRRGMMHVGMYVGEGRFVHAPSKGGKVRVDAVGASYWQRRFIEARRLAQA
jgi:cell wall-associated NlpC family hydrolase